MPGSPGASSMVVGPSPPPKSNAPSSRENVKFFKSKSAMIFSYPLPAETTAGRDGA